jgi:hypothetical protein
MGNISQFHLYTLSVASAAIGTGCSLLATLDTRIDSERPDATLEASAEVATEKHADAGAGEADVDALPLVETIATETSCDAQLGRIAVDDMYVYWVREDTGAIRRAPKQGGSTGLVKLNDTPVADIALCGTHVCSNAYGGGPQMFPSTGGAPTLLPESCALGTRVFALGKSVFYGVNDCTGDVSKRTRIYQTHLDHDAGGLDAATTVGQGGKFTDGLRGDIVADANDVYVAGQGEIGRMPPDLSDYMPIESQVGRYAEALALDETNLFARSVRTLAVINRTSSRNVTVIPLGAEVVLARGTLRTQLALDSAYVYVSGEMGLARVKKGTTQIEPLYTAYGVVGVAQDVGYVYFSVPKTGSIARIKKPL